MTETTHASIINTVTETTTQPQIKQEAMTNPEEKEPSSTNKDTTISQPNQYPEFIQDPDFILEDSNDDKTSETASVVKPNKIQQSTLSDYPVDSNVDINIFSVDESVKLPSDFPNSIIDVLASLPNISFVDSEKSKKWAEVLNDGMELTVFKNVLTDSFSQPEELYRQRNLVNNIPLEAKAPSFKSASNQVMGGEKAILRLTSHLGIGSTFQVPLWHSGFWITLKPPTESEVIEINRLLINDKIKFGRYSYGLLHSNATVYTNDKLVDFALSHIYDTTIKLEANVNFKDIISCQDIPILLWGLICTMYPQGFKYERACINNPDKCNHVTEAVLNLFKLQYTSTASLTDWQKNHMSNRQAKVKTLEEVKRYSSELSKLQDTQIFLNKDTDKEIRIIVKTPSITEYVEAGFNWIENIVNTVNKTLGSDADINERNSLINKHGQAAAMRQYVHWIKSINYGDDITINDADTINKAIDTLTADDYLREEFLSNIVKYINTSSISIIGIPVYDCPVCGATHESTSELPTHKNIIPLDVIQLFFVLVTQRLSKIMER